jgi:hypothetical protein
LRSQRQYGGNLGEVLSQDRPLQRHAARREHLAVGAARGVFAGSHRDEPDLTLDEVLSAMRKHKIPGSRTAVWRFFQRHKIRSAPRLQANDNSMRIDKPAIGSDHRHADGLYLHLGPFSRQVIHRIEQQLDETRNTPSNPCRPTRLPDIAIVA